MKQDFQFSMNRVSINIDLLKMDASGCDSKQNQNHDKCQCDCKKLEDWSSRKVYYIWNSSTCDVNPSTFFMSYYTHNCTHQHSCKIPSSNLMSVPNY